MTTLTLRYQRGHFTISGPDFEMRKFKSRREAKDWCAQHPTQPSESRRDPCHPCTKNPSDCRPAIAGQRRQNLLLPPVRLGAQGAPSGAQCAMQAFSLVIVHAVDHLRTVHEFLDYIERYSDDRKKPSLLDAPPLRREVREAVS